MYYLPNPMISGIGQFFAGFGQRRQEKEAIENRQAALNNQAWGSAIGSGLQSAGQVGAMAIMDQGLNNLSMPNGMGPPSISPMQRMSMLGSIMPGLGGFAKQAGDFAQEDMRLSNQQILQQGVYDRVMDLEQQRSQNDMLEMAWEQFSVAAGLPSTRKWGGAAGGGGGMMFGGAAMGAPQVGVDPNAPPGPPAGAPAEDPAAMPPPAIYPASTPVYQQAERDRNAAILEASQLWGDNSKPFQEKMSRIAPLMQQAGHAYQTMQRTSAPKPPTTQELVDAGRIPGSDTTVLFDQKGTPHGITIHPASIDPRKQPNFWKLPEEQRRAELVKFAKMSLIPGSELGPGYDQDSDYSFNEDGTIVQFKHNTGGGGEGNEKRDAHYQKVVSEVANLTKPNPDAQARQTVPDVPLSPAERQREIDLRMGEFHRLQGEAERKESLKIQRKEYQEAYGPLASKALALKGMSDQLKSEIAIETNPEARDQLQKQLTDVLRQMESLAARNQGQ